MSGALVSTSFVSENGTNDVERVGARVFKSFLRFVSFERKLIRTVVMN